MSRALLLALLVASTAPAAAPEGDAVPRAPFLKGADLSVLQKLESLGVVYKQDGRPTDALAILKHHGCNIIRLRLFHTPNGKDAVCNSLQYTAILARRVKAAGFQLLLDFHYSDTWADPGHQTLPAAWADLPFDRLEQAVYEYSRHVVDTLKRSAALPDIVQIGNEITPGMMWPAGRVGGKDFNTPERWQRLGRLLKAGRRGVRDAGGPGVQIMLHIDRGGSPGVTRWFFDHMAEQGVEFDLVGLSYYPWWHGTMDALRRNLAATARRYRKPIVVVETAHPHRLAPGRTTVASRQKHPLPYPATPDGQRQFLAELLRVVRATPDGLGRGVLWWGAEYVPVEGMRTGWASKAMFDAKGNALPVFTSFDEAEAEAPRPR